MSVKANDLSIGQYVKLNDKIWKLVDKMHVKPGKGGAFIQAKLKGLDGSKLEHRFQSTDNADIVIVEKKRVGFSYKEKNSVVLNDLETYEEIEVTKDMISENSWFLFNSFVEDAENEIDIQYADEKIVDLLLSSSIKVTIDLADPVVKGQTAASSYKNAVIKNDIKIMVPPYIEAGDKVIIDIYSENGIEFLKKA